jgi:glycosyltransferase involved in cell wall biosynthesis
LEKKYGFKRVNYFPFPSESDLVKECYKFEGEPLLLNLGYIAPDKGLDILPEIKSKLDNIKTIIVGNFYESYLSTKNGFKFKEDLITLMDKSGVSLMGYLEEDQLMELIKKYRTIATLPYIAGYNASYSALFFVKLGIPVVATNLGLFLEIKSNGAGIVLVDRTPESFAHAIDMILKSHDLTESLIENDRKYCAQYSFKTFSEFLITYLYN